MGNFKGEISQFFQLSTTYFQTAPPLPSTYKQMNKKYKIYISVA